MSPDTSFFIVCRELRTQIVSAWRAAIARSIALATTTRSEEHTSELQSRGHLVCRLLLEKKKNPLTLLRPLYAANHESHEKDDQNHLLSLQQTALPLPHPLHASPHHRALASLTDHDTRS